MTLYIVVDDFGASGTAYRETDEANCDQQSVVDDFLSGQFNNPPRVVAFNTVEGWAREASEDIEDAVIEAARVQNKALSEGARRFYERHTGYEAPADVTALPALPPIPNGLPAARLGGTLCAMTRKQLVPDWMISPAYRPETPSSASPRTRARCASSARHVVGEAP